MLKQTHLMPMQEICRDLAVLNKSEFTWVPPTAASMPPRFSSTAELRVAAIDWSSSHQVAVE
jgi:hypothetical protein